MGESLLFPTFPPQCLRWKLVPLSLRIVSFTLLTEERPQDVSGSASSRLWSLILEPSVGCIGLFHRDCAHGIILAYIPFPPAGI